MNKKAVKEFESLLDVADKLLGPGGCPWDQEQTLTTMRSSVLEEACEVIEAIDENDDENLIEELGDLLYNVIFFCKLAEKEKKFSTEAVVERIREKLIARHPHVFGEKTLHDAQAALEQWEVLKKKEKAHRKSALDGIPKGLPALLRAYKVAKVLDQSKSVSQNAPVDEEEELGMLLWEIVTEARKKRINPEIALGRVVAQKEREFRESEKSSDPQ